MREFSAKTVELCLDKASSGSIYINGKKITSRFSYKVDKIRNLNILQIIIELMN